MAIAQTEPPLPPPFTVQGVARALRSLNNGIAEEPLPPRLISLVERFENARKSQLEYLERQHRH